jgi:hypothetical protein
MAPESAARFTSGELGAIYWGNHWSRDNSGIMRKTPPPENIGIKAASKKCQMAINEFLNVHADTAKKKETQGKAPEKTESVYRGSAALKHTIAAGIGVKGFFEKSKDNDPAAYSTDLDTIAGLWKQGQRRFKAFIRGRFLAIDIDRKPGKADGLETFYRLFPRETLPAELRDIPQSFPCYVLTPSGGFHLYFRYEGPELKLRELAPGVEVKEWQITAPGSSRETGDYILHGGLNNAPPLYGLLIDAIEETRKKREREKEERTKPRTRAAADRPMRQCIKPSITLDDLAREALTAYAGNHDRQVSFSGRACRCKYSGAETLAYVKSRPDIFGNDNDTANTVMSVFRDNGGCL